MESDHLKFLKRLKRLEGHLERLASDFFYPHAFVGSACMSTWRPPADVYETDTSIVVRIEAPGLHYEDIHITLCADALVVRAMRRERQPGAKRICQQLEIRYGFFERAFPLPRGIRHEAAEAAYADGFLTITIPKCEQAVELTGVLHIRI